MNLLDQIYVTSLNRLSDKADAEQVNFTDLAVKHPNCPHGDEDIHARNTWLLSKEAARLAAIAHENAPTLSLATA